MQFMVLLHFARIFLVEPLTPIAGLGRGELAGDGKGGWINQVGRGSHWMQPPFKGIVCCLLSL